MADALVGEKGFLAMLDARRQYRTLVLSRRDLGLIRPGEKLFIIRDTVAGATR